MGAQEIPQDIDSASWMHDRPWIDHPDADVDAYVASLKKPPAYDLSAKLKSWQQNGFVIFEKVVSDADIEGYLEDIAVLMRDFEQYRIGIEVRGKQLISSDLEGFPADLTGVKLNHMHCFSRHAARLSLTPHVTDFLAHVFRNPASVCQSLTFWRGSEQLIHIDYPYVRQQSPLSYLAASWIPLEDVHPDSGPLGYYPGAHKVDRSGFFDWGDGAIVQLEQAQRSPAEFSRYLRERMSGLGIECQVFCPKRGDVLLWHGNLPHEGTAVNNPALTRKSYVTHYTAERALPDWMRNHDDFGRPIGVFENGAYCYRSKWFDPDPVLPSWTTPRRSGLSQLTSAMRAMKRRLSGS